MSYDINILYGKEERCSCCGHITKEEDSEFITCITYNLSQMMDECGIYEHLIEKGIQLSHKTDEFIKPLHESIKRLESDPEYFRKFNASNGFGKYEDLVRSLKQILEACKDNPGEILKVI